jgi:hypothetical protein
MTKRKTPWSCQCCTGLGITIPRATPRSVLCRWCADDLAAAGQRWCSKGRHGSSDWPPNGRMCRACQSERNAAYHAAHREELNQYNRDQYAAHHEERIAANHAYYDANRQQLLEQKRAYYETHRETIKAKVRAHRPHRPLASIARERERQREKRDIYAANERAAALRRKLAAWRQMIGREAP